MKKSPESDRVEKLEEGIVQEPLFPTTSLNPKLLVFLAQMKLAQEAGAIVDVLP